MSNKMLIDAVHPEETRVVVVRDKRVEDFDFEAASRKPLRGNIYLAKVTRVEPSLQAAFVEYGGNRHGFLAFSEIHPDWYQIPQADRAALIEEERAAATDEDEPAATGTTGKPRRRRRGARSERTGAVDATGADAADVARSEAAAPDAGEADARATDADARATDTDTDATQAAADTSETASAEAVPDALSRAAAQVEETIASEVEAAVDAPLAQAEADASELARPVDPEAPAASPAQDTASAAAPADADGAEAAGDGENAPPETPKPRRRRRTTKKTAEGLADPEVAGGEETDESEENGGDDDEAGTVTSLGSQDALEEIPERRPRAAPRRQYKIQEVIRRRQLLVVQVVKEERGTKGAALTTYLSLAGRYSVLMPNTDRGGGVSRKITDNSDRKRLKGLVSELEVPEGMGVILRTAGASRTKTEIKRDFEYLLRLWESVRDLTLKSIAPALVYEEGNLVKRSIRDLYSKEIEEVLVAGEDAYREAKDFMRMLMPSHAKNVKPYRESTPIFTAYGVEAQLDAMFSPQVTLPSKGYIVINPTEALVSIDVNSGRSTKESNIEDTALKTNLEAADEVARQLRLRDLAGLIVIDFIDMDEKRHNRAVEKRLKDALKLDRSRIQVGRISPFGLLEMSRQRIRQGMVESSVVPCAVCGGTGHIRSTQSVALHCLRALEEHLLKHAGHNVTLKTSAAVALYILNQKRAHLNALEDRFGLEIAVDADETLSGQHLEIESGAAARRAPGAQPPTVQVAPDAVAADDVEPEEDETAATADAAESANAERSSRRRRRRRRRGGEDRQGTDGESARQADGAAPAGGADDGDGGDGDTPLPPAARNDDVEADGAPLAGGEPEPGAIATSASAEAEEDDDRPTRRRRGRRGGRRHRREGEEVSEGEEMREDEEIAQPEVARADATAPETAEVADADAIYSPMDEPATGGEPAESTDEAAADMTNAMAEADADEEASTDAAAAASGAESGAEADGDAPPSGAEPAPEQKSEQRPRRAGWWQRRSFF